MDKNLLVDAKDEKTLDYPLMLDDASEIESGPIRTPRQGISKFALSREYRKAVRSLYYAARRMSDKDIDKYFTAQRPGFETDHDRVTSVALSLSRVYLSCKDAFPTPQMKSEWAAAVWREACAKTRVNFDPSMRSDLANGCTKLFIDAKKRVTDAVDIFYGFDTRHTTDSISNNATLARALLSYRVDDGILFREYFSPLPIPAIAFALTLIECCIDEWTDGTRQETTWDEERFKVTYRSHVGLLDDFQLRAAQGFDSFEHIRSDLLKEAREHAGQPPL
ncbi:hypothetical protein EDB92DRAFT_2106766 [Lactarius akahatsu]|uniref:DUF6532 domain-containing protein n=1 Tax=Lactarius akahatsu TaxID=416441 RepID=A0AAD4L6A8_9AGAM|nr:hypothetical protein EDB92DRAFT_2106766 [Lactarius akahatsu]